MAHTAKRALGGPTILRALASIWTQLGIRSLLHPAQSASSLKKVASRFIMSTQIQFSILDPASGVILPVGLCSRYGIPNLAVSDTLTASPTLERHLGGLDFAQKVLNVEVIHGLNDLIHFLGGKRSIQNELDIVTADRFSDYANYFQDKQNVLAYECTKLQEYVGLTQKKSEDTYRAISWANKFLIGWGGLFLFLTAFLAIFNAFSDKPDWKLPLVTGGLSLLQLISAFFWRPMVDLQKNLTNLAIFRMILESHSLKTALARFHLTTPQTLHDDMGSKIESEAATKQVQALVEQIKAIDGIEEQDYKALKELGFGTEETAKKILEDTSPNMAQEKVLDAKNNDQEVGHAQNT